jgi:hypothetical protein
LEKTLERKKIVSRARKAGFGDRIESKMAIETRMVLSTSNSFNTAQMTTSLINDLQQHVCVNGCFT